MDNKEWERWYVILNMNHKYEICRKRPKNGLSFGTYEECRKWIEQKEIKEKMTELEKELNRRADIIIRQEKRIAELENKLEQTEKDLTDYQFNYPTIKELQKENAELKGRKGVANLWR